MPSTTNFSLNNTFLYFTERVSLLAVMLFFTYTSRSFTLTKLYASLFFLGSAGNTVGCGSPTPQELQPITSIVRAFELCFFKYSIVFSSIFIFISSPSLAKNKAQKSILKQLLFYYIQKHLTLRNA